MNQVKRRQCVLVVDDQPRLLRFVEIGLKLHGFEVITATSGEEALEIVEKAHPDIMVLDIIMPGMGGIEVLKKLRTFTQMPVIAFSASPGNQDEAMRCGATDFMTKPFQPDEMERKIRGLLRC